jgi:hypothetical protein
MADFTTPEDEAFFAAIGRLSISWAHLEFGIDVTISIARLLRPPTPIVPRTGLSRKLAYLRRWLRDNNEPTFRIPVEQLLSEIEAAAEQRHDIIHGVVLGYAEGSGMAQMARIIGEQADPYRKKTYSVTTIDVLKSANAANKLATRTLNLGTRLQDGLAALIKELNQPHAKSE